MGLIDQTFARWSEQATRGKALNALRSLGFIALAGGLIVLGIWLVRGNWARETLGEQSAALVALIPLLGSLAALGLAAASLMISMVSFLRSGKWG